MGESHKKISIRDVWEARKRISSIVAKTPLISSPVLSEQFGAPVYLKLENHHEIGAFKVRGAANKILSLSLEEQQRGVTTFSTGNHGMAVAYVAQKLGIRAVICISNRVPKVKVDNIKRFGAEVEIYGNSQDDAGVRSYQLQKEEGLTVIKPFDDPYVIAGQGTIGLELLEDLPSIENVVVPLSGGGLLSGVALALKETDPSIHVTGVSMERAAVMYESLQARKPVILKEEPTLADSLLGGIGLDNHYTFKMVSTYMDSVVRVSEKSIAKAMGFMADKHRMIVEGAAATSVATILDNKISRPKKNIVLIISGCNVDLSVIHDAIKNYF
ncbi:hydroxyectoine utilization dehydratase EutB [Anaerobacillus sp. MEB173]|uniref:hydroxyectoine utilization dehydratase EutB n=1 Tax=Anaerobacillus sp. MEB173 TaxID=3383345 RepID=UPI003F8E1201